MKSPTVKENKNEPLKKRSSHNKESSKNAIEFKDGRLESDALSRLNKMANNSPRNSQTAQLNTMANSLPDSGITIQRSVESAAEELHAKGTITVKKSKLKGKFAKKHGIKGTDLAAIQTALEGLREAAVPAPTVEQVDMTDSANWPTSGGMIEGDGQIIAGVKGWDEGTTDWSCEDKSHTPNGKVYKDSRNNYYGADNTGHVGWGFKVWHKKKKGELYYAGNISWDGSEWNHDARGTKRSLK